jgi:hypothetical protein
MAMGNLFLEPDAGGAAILRDELDTGILRDSSGNARGKIPNVARSAAESARESSRWTSLSAFAWLGPQFSKEASSMTIADLSARFTQCQADLAALEAKRDETDSDALDQLADARDAIIDLIERAPCDSLAALRLKARALKSIYPDGPPLECDNPSQDLRLASQIIDGLAAQSITA